jgi:hypothetical protein
MAPHGTSTPTARTARPADAPATGRRGRSIRRAAAALGAITVVSTAGVVGIADPAAALVTVSASGTTVTANVSGTATIAVTCAGNVVRINGSATSPAVPCATFSKLTVNGDGGPQNVDGRELENAAFAAKPTLTADLGDGVDLVWDTKRADTIKLGAGNDNYYPVRGSNNVTTDLGADVDTVRFFGTDADEELVGSSSNATLLLTHSLGGAVEVLSINLAERLEVSGYGGDNVLDMSGIVTSSTIDVASIYAGAGDDVVRAPQIAYEKFTFRSNLFAGAGNNTIHGSPGNDNISSEGNGDVIFPGGGDDFITDRTSPRSGRTINPGGLSSFFFFESGLGDSVSRIRPNGTGTTVTNSLNRPGQQQLTSTYSNVVTNLGSQTTADGRGLVDVVALGNGRDVSVRGDSTDNDLLDVTIPTGSWTVSGTPQTSGWITPTAGGYEPIRYESFGAVNVHGPWTNKDSGFVHRVTRDLMFRFATPGVIGSTSLALTDGTTTRQAVVEGLMGTDEYRGLDVDRIFTKYLDRKADPAGLTYWKNSIANGKALWRFRAQLFGSNEYFTKAGGTNAQYLDKVYFDVLGRLPDPSGRAYWTKKLDNGADRGSVALQFINANEFRRFLIDDQFLRFLDRKPTPAEQATWLATLTSSPTGEQDLIEALAVGNDYYNRT